jgi:hypothetical protein
VPLAEGLGPMFADDVIMPGPPATLHRGRDAVLAILRASPDAAARASWTPIRVGLAADAQHGFTFGFMTLTHADGRTVPLKYMAYWVKTPQGWRVAGYKRARRPEGEAAATTMTPHLPPALVGPRTGTSAIEPLRRSLVAAERAFSDEAQKVGLGPAFAQFGHATAVNMGGAASAGYVVGPRPSAGWSGRTSGRRARSVVVRRGASPRAATSHLFASSARMRRPPARRRRRKARCSRSDAPVGGRALALHRRVRPRGRSRPSAGADRVRR